MKKSILYTGVLGILAIGGFSAFSDAAATEQAKIDKMVDSLKTSFMAEREAACKADAMKEAMAAFNQAEPTEEPSAPAKTNTTTPTRTNPRPAPAPAPNTGGGSSTPVTPSGGQTSPAKPQGPESQTKWNTNTNTSTGTSESKDKWNTGTKTEENTSKSKWN